MSKSSIIQWLAFDSFSILPGQLIEETKHKFACIYMIIHQMRTIFNHRNTLVHSTKNTKDRLTEEEMTAVDECWCQLIEKFETTILQNMVLREDIETMKQLQQQFQHS